MSAQETEKTKSKAFGAGCLFDGNSAPAEERSGWGNLGVVAAELRAHAPYTLAGTLTAVAAMAVLVGTHAPRGLSVDLFWGLHPIHVLLSALVTAGMYRLHGRRGVWLTILVGYVGSVGIATLSDCLIPFVGESLLGLPNRGIHLGFIEKWWLVNPLALVGIAMAMRWPKTKFPHAGHVLLSTWASLFHMTMAMGSGLSLVSFVTIPVFLFLAVWIPCCTSDIVFPLLVAHPHVAGSSMNEGRCQHQRDVHVGAGAGIQRSGEQEENQ